MSSDDPLSRSARKLTAADIADWNQRQRPPANWQKWKHCAKGELWQCVALSFNVEPIEATMHIVHPGFVISAGPKPRPWFAEHPDMKERLEVALSNAGADAVSKLHPLPNQSGDPAAMLFSTAEFGDWARCIWPTDVPSAFPGNAQEASPQLPGSKASQDLLAKAEKAPERGRKLLREILLRLDADPEGIPLDKGGRRIPGSLKSKAMALALTPEFGWTKAPFLKAWTEYPKKPVNPHTAEPQMRKRR